MSVKRTFETAVVFDYGGVLTTSPRKALASWAKSTQVDPNSFEILMRSWMSSNAIENNPVHLMERGEISGQEFNAALSNALTTSDGSPLTPGNHLEQIFELIQREQAMLNFLHTIKSQNIGIALLSNSWDNDYPEDLLEIFDVIVLSGNTGLRKPDAEIFLLTLEKLGIGAEQTIMVDDNRHNIAASQTLGMAGVLHETPTQTIQSLNEALFDI